MSTIYAKILSAVTITSQIISCVPIMAKIARNDAIVAAITLFQYEEGYTNDLETDDNITLLDDTGAFYLTWG